MTLDVDSLYTNINDREGLAAVAEVFAKTKHKDLNCSLRPENNDFIFNESWYLQISGTAKGKHFAPNHSNIFRAKWEEETLKKALKQPLE